MGNKVFAKIRKKNCQKLFIGEIDGFKLHLSIQNECNHCDKQVFIEKMFKIVYK